jgi:hypothetical protein
LTFDADNKWVPTGVAFKICENLPYLFLGSIDDDFGFDTLVHVVLV